jgi:chromosome condensin MukBEF ATPase and DNA-binding subunit MukB
VEKLDWQGWSSFILAITGLLGIVSTHLLNRRGKRVQAQQQEAAEDLAERAQGFDEMKELVDRLNHEIERIEARADREAQAQARRCRTSLDHFMVAFITLIGQVGSEQAKQAAEKAITEVEVHLAEDHPDDQPATD